MLPKCTEHHHASARRDFCMGLIPPISTKYLIQLSCVGLLLQLQKQATPVAVSKQVTLWDGYSTHCTVHSAGLAHPTAQALTATSCTAGKGAC